MKKPYPHQQDVIDKVRRAFIGGHKSVLIQASPRFGKTVVSSNIIQSSQAKGTRVIFCVHRDNLINQTANTFRDDDIDFGYIKSGMKYDPSKKVHIASVQTLILRLDSVKCPDVFFVDECQLAKSDSYDQVISYFKAKGALIIGLSGTPWRLDGRPLDELFDTMVYGPSVRWLIDNKFLSDFKYYAPSVSEDFDKKLVGDAIHHYKKLANGMLAIAYCINRDHSKMVCDQFLAAGIKAAHIDGTMNKDELKAIYRDYGDRKIDVLCSISLISEGFDLSAQTGKDTTVECVIMLKRTKSLSSFLQMVMRCMTKKVGGGRSVIIDHGGNVFIHGMPDDDRNWSLAGRETGADSNKRAEVEPPIICEDCFQAVVKPVPEFCPYCNAVMKKQKAVIKIIEGELQEIKEAERLAIKEKLKQEEREAKTLNDMILVMTKKGSKNPVHAAKMKIQGRAARQARFKR